jgi:hypothetical protein
MKNGKIRHYSSKNAYERSLKAMFANQNTNNSVKRKVSKSKFKSSKRMKHAGVGKVSSVKKKRCNYCRKENLPLDKDKCKDCEKLLAEYKQPEEHKLREELKDLMVAYEPEYDNEDLFAIQTLIDEINEEAVAYVTDIDLVDKMQEINDIMGGHGIEGISEQIGDHSLNLIYVNMGDTYDPTVIYNINEGMATVGNWGSYVEELGNEEENPDWDEAIMSGEEDL